MLSSTTSHYFTTKSSNSNNTSTSNSKHYKYNNGDSASAFEPFNLHIPLSDLKSYVSSTASAAAAAPSSSSSSSSFNKPVSARVRMPSGRTANPCVEQNLDGTVSIKYQPSEIGLHELDVYYNGQPIQGSPFKFHVDAINSLTGDQTTTTTTSSTTTTNTAAGGGGYVTAYGTGLSHGFSHQPCEFRIVTKDAGMGGLAVAVEGPSKAEIHCRDNKNGTCDVVYYPTAPGDYTISVKFAERHIVGSPFVAQIGGEARSSKRNQLVLENQSDFSLKVVEGDLSSLQAMIRSPTGFEEPCMLKKLSNGSLGISFTPREVGEHVVSVLRDHKHIKNSPFRIQVGQAEIGDAGRVTL